MRRALALTLLALFSWMLIAPLFAPDAEASLPPCCRRHGKHHCMMQRLLAAGGKLGGPPAAEEPCPCQHSSGGAAQSRMYTTLAPHTLDAWLVQSASLLERSATPPAIAVLDIPPQRGPPISRA